MARSRPVGGAARHDEHQGDGDHGADVRNLACGQRLDRQDCVELAAAYGVPLDPWQADIVRGLLRESGVTWSAS